MKKPVKILIIGCLIVLTALVAAAVLAPLLINPNSFKPEIVAFLKNKTGRDVQIEGDITVSFSPKLGVNTGKITVGNKPGFPDKPFAAVDSSQIKLKFVPLLSGKVEVDSINVDGLTLNLGLNQQGQNNWDDLAVSHSQPPSADSSQSPKTGADTNTQALAALAIGAISIKKGHVLWENSQTGKTLDINNIELISDKLVLGEPFNIDLKSDISGNQLPFPGEIKATTALHIDASLNGVQLSNTRFEWFGKHLPSQQPLTAVGTVNTAEINLKQQTVKSSGLQLQSEDVKLAADITGEAIFDKPSLQGQMSIAPFNLGLALKQWGVEQPATGDAKALSNCALTSQFHLTPELAELSNLDITLDDSRAKGTLAIYNLAAPAINFDLLIDKLDLDRYLPPREEAELTSPGFTLAAGAINLPLDWLKKLDANGKLAFGTLKVNHMTLQDTKLIVSTKNGDVKISQTADRFYQGAYSGSLTVAAYAQKPQLLLHENLTDIQLEPYLQDIKGKAKLGGLLTATTTLQSHGNKAKELRANLSGNASFFLKDGFIHGFNLEKMIAQAKNTVINGKQLETKEAADRTVFNAIKGTININKGQLSNNDLLANAAAFQSKGQGSALLETGQLDYTLTTKLLKAKATPNKPMQLHDTPIVIHIGGIFSKPTFALDAGALLTDKNKDKLKSLIDHNKDKIEKLFNKLDKKTGSDVKGLLKKIF